MNTKNILDETRNFWKKGMASRASMLADGDAFFEALTGAMLEARHSIIMIGWDFDFKTPLRGGGSKTFSELLLQTVKRNHELRIHILEWDFAMIYAFERGILPLLGIACPSHRRIKFFLDEKHPLGGSHHQKIIVIDDQVAFSGGLDVTRQRWDTPQHIPDDPRRVDDSQNRYGPYHDVQMIVEGDVAKQLGELARQRWKMATGKSIRRADSNSDCWPSSVQPDWTNVEVAISRTHPAHDEENEIREIQYLLCDAIQKAKDWIYIESQYLTSSCVADAIQQRLDEENGPEFALVLPKACSGWLEENTMDVIRSKTLKKLIKSDKHHHLGIYYPEVSGIDIHVHSKLLIVDDTFLTIGSANLSNRSMGLDTECNLSIESVDDEKIQENIKRVRNRLLGEHLGLTPDEVQEELDHTGSILKLINSRQNHQRSLKNLEIVPDAPSNTAIVEEDFIDPERPMEVERWLLGALPKDERHKRWDFLRLTGTLLLAGLVIAALWHWTPVREFLNPAQLARAGDRFVNNPFSPFIVLLSYIGGVVILFPVTVLTLATIFVYGPLAGFGYAVLGSVSSAAASYWIGRIIGRRAVRKLAGRRLNRLSRFLAARGVLTVSLATMLPLAPFGIVNMVAGASHIRFRHFVVGSFIGVIPTIVGMTLFERGLQSILNNPQPSSLILIVILAAILLFASVRFQKWIQAKQIPASV